MFWQKVEGKMAGTKAVRHIIAVASGKGGVGKSTCTVNLAVALRRQGATVGVLDADIYGPNLPMMLGVQGPPRVKNDEVQPVFAYGLKVMSLGFVVKQDEPIVWRGPLIHGALAQLLNDVAWGELDYLLIDLPPGTGDVQLSLAQLTALSGAVIVTTPQDVALEDVYKGMAAFQQLKVPLLGVIENMSFFACPHCGGRTDIFAHGGGQKAAQRLDIPFLGAVALDPAIRAGGDDGQPITAVSHHSPQAQSFVEIAEKLVERLATVPVRSEGDRIQLADISVR
ncbi:MAG: Mrp/NBP35 family ATP-binding protein [Ardenticatenaceae bacterium]|nr:Mrp/NBP35 family ATP-binding protein [Ardenticatenaceae bacterium]